MDYSSMILLCFLISLHGTWAMYYQNMPFPYPDPQRSRPRPYYRFEPQPPPPPPQYQTQSPPPGPNVFRWSYGPDFANLFQIFDYDGPLAENVDNFDFSFSDPGFDAPDSSSQVRPDTFSRWSDTFPGRSPMVKPQITSGFRPSRNPEQRFENPSSFREKQEEAYNKYRDYFFNRFGRNFGNPSSSRNY